MVTAVQTFKGIPSPLSTLCLLRHPPRRQPAPRLTHFLPWAAACTMPQVQTSRQQTAMSMQQAHHRRLQQSLQKRRAPVSQKRHCPPARKQAPGKEASLALGARLASEAALEARGKASGKATAAAEEDVSQAGSAAVGAPSESAGAEGQSANVTPSITQAYLVMTVGAPEPAARKKGLRSPAAAKVSPVRPHASVEESLTPEAGTENSGKTPQPNATPTGQLEATSESSVHAAAEEGCEPADLADGALSAAQGQAEAAVTQTGEGACSNAEAPSRQTAAPVTPDVTLSGNDHISLQVPESYEVCMPKS